MPVRKTKVLVECITYNHAAYIKTALDGFVMQKTTFPFVVLVVDDASTDETPKIIKSYADKYPGIIEACLLQENHYSRNKSKKYIFAPWEELAEYVAICEGDDFWIDPYKLQKQVDAMDLDHSISLCHTSFKAYLEDGDKYEEFDDSYVKYVQQQKASDLIATSVLSGYKYIIQTMTIMYRVSSYNKIEPLLKVPCGTFMMGDTQLCACLSSVGKVKFIDDVTAVYRKHIGSACRPADKRKAARFYLSVFEMRAYYTEILNLPSSVVDAAQRDYRKSLLSYKLKYDKEYKQFVKLKYPTWIHKVIYSLAMSKCGLKIFAIFNKIRTLATKGQHKI